MDALAALPASILEGRRNSSLDLIGLLVLADLNAIARRTALMGTSPLADIFVLCPGLHRQQDAADLNRGEYPACAAMTTGYVFRIENQATVHYLQRVGRPGQLTCLSVTNPTSHSSSFFRAVCEVFDFQGSSVFGVLAYGAAVLLTVTCLLLLTLWKDWPGVGVVAILIDVRLINILVIRRRAKQGWKGEPEPGKQSDLIVLMSQDRWIRIRGAVDDVKAVTSGEWLREATSYESFISGLATLLLYLDVVLACSMSHPGKLLLLVLFFCSAGLLGLVNESTLALRMYGRTIKVDGPRQPYKRRLLLTKQLVKETGRSDWAIRLGMAQPSDIQDQSDDVPAASETSEGAKEEQVIL